MQATFKKKLTLGYHYYFVNFREMKVCLKTSLAHFTFKSGWLKYVLGETLRHKMICTYLPLSDKQSKHSWKTESEIAEKRVFRSAFVKLTCLPPEAVVIADKLCWKRRWGSGGQK